MTGIAELFVAALPNSGFLWWLEVVRWLPRPFFNWIIDRNAASIAKLPRPQCPYPKFPDPRPTMRLQNEEACPSWAASHLDGCKSCSSALGKPTPGVLADGENNEQRAACSSDAKWTLILPITSEGSTTNAFWARLQDSITSLERSLSCHDQKRTTLFVAHDLRDPLLDSDEARRRITTMVSKTKLQVRFAAPLPPALEGKLCWIWDFMAQNAVKAGADFVVLLGDDVTIETEGWQDEVEREFRDVSRQRQLPFGAACIALRDSSFPGFPSFPVIHRFHFEVFGSLFPKEFKNQHGDPFLFETYRRFGAARFAPRASLRNSVGGSGPARYSKDTTLAWQGELLKRAIEHLAKSLPDHAARIPCIDVVIPTYRCDLSILSQLAALRLERDASLHTLIVVDNPNSSMLGAVQELVSYHRDRTVRVFVMPINSGASAARNAGIAQSFGDYCVLLDDDVIPQPNLLDAYLGAIARRPDAVGYVGMTMLPEPKTRMQHAVAASHLTFFYGIASKLTEPPWGVTANFCFSRNAGAKVFFDARFPKSGGGEDIDFSLNLRKKCHGPLVAVPSAVVVHPYWDRPFAQVAGWASGDVLNLDAHPSLAFRHVPNWAELLIGCLLCGLYRPACIAFACEFVQLWLRYLPETHTTLPITERALVSVLASFLPMLQDAVRLKSKLQRLRFSQIGQSVDWMDRKGETGHVALMQFESCVKAILFLLICMAFSPLVCPAMRSICIVIVLIGFILRMTGHRRPIAPRLMPQATISAALTRCSCARPPHGRGAVPFVVIAFQRTGSNMLCSFLDGVPSISMHSELFCSKAVHTHCGGIDRSVEARAADPRQLLLDALSVRSESGGAVGFKLFPDHMTGRVSDKQKALCMQVILDPGIKKIVLRRDDELAVAVSVVRAQVTGAYIFSKTEDRRCPSKDFALGP